MVVHERVMGATCREGSIAVQPPHACLPWQPSYICHAYINRTDVMELNSYYSESADLAVVLSRPEPIILE